MKHFFTANLDLNKIEVSFTVRGRYNLFPTEMSSSSSQAPQLCQSQEASYAITFTDTTTGERWQEDSQPLRETAGDLVRMDLTDDVLWFKLDKTYNVSVTISTELGNVTSSTEFGTPLKNKQFSL